MAATGERPFFIVSSPRSGSTLLRLILDAHPRLAVPPPAWLFHYVCPYLYSYGDLGRETNVRAMVEDALKTPSMEEWPIHPSVDEVRAEMRTPTFAEMYAALHRLYARSQGKERWGEKTPRDCFYMTEIKAMYPDVRFIHILRDGRDSAIDISDSELWPNSLYAAALLWRDFVESCLDEAEALGPEACLTIRYEDLCADPKTVLAKVCNFLGEDFSPRLLAHHETDSTREWSKGGPHAKTAGPIGTDYVGMFRTRLRSADRAVIEGVIGDTLVRAGYPVEGSPRALPPRIVRQILETDAISNTKAVAYARWHERRRKERRAAGVWTDTDRETDLLGFH